jgi:23S rRNA pseudouridine955/2504/2580 synthase
VFAVPTIVAIHQGVVVVDKPAGVRADGSDQVGVPDLPSWLDARTNIPSGTRPAHRLDLQASGLVLCAAAPKMRAMLGEALGTGRIEKTYLALVHGRTRKKGIIRRTLKDNRRKRPLMAVTRYRTLESLGPVSLLAVRIETGRKHQIRRHFEGIGHPLVGDSRYRGRRKQRVTGAPARLWLHARALVLPGPLLGDATAADFVFEAPLPSELLDHLALLRDALVPDGIEE